MSSWRREGRCWNVDNRKLRSRTATVAADEPCSARWFAVQCLFEDREFLAAAQLANQGYPVFLPCSRAHAPARAQVRYRPSPALFPGYLFVKLDPSIDRWPQC